MKNVPNEAKNETNHKKDEAFIANYNYNVNLFYVYKKNKKKIENIEENNKNIQEKIEKLNIELNSVEEEKKAKIQEDLENLDIAIKSNTEKIDKLRIEDTELEKQIKDQDDNLRNESYLELKNVKKSYDDNVVLKGINLNLKKGERVAIIGHNGSGKSTLTEIISKVKKGTSGTINYNFAHSKDDFGQKMAIQFQKLNYPEGYKVKEVINFFYKMVPKNKSYSKEEFKQLIKDFGITEFYKKNLTSLSGGQQQRVNLFLTFIKKPSFLILDELSAGLDIDIYEKITKLFLDYIKEYEVTAIIVSHNFKELKYFAEKVFLLKEGILSEELGIDALTEDKFFELIKRQRKIKTDFKFDFTRDKELKENIVLKYYRDLKDIYIYWRYPLSEISENISKFQKERDELLEKLTVLIEEGNAIYEVLKELIDNKSNSSKTKKMFTKKLKEQAKVQTKIDKLENKVDHYAYLISDKFSLVRIKWLKFVVSYQIKYYEKDLSKKEKKLITYKEKIGKIETEETSSDEKLQNYELLFQKAQEKLNAKKEYLKNKEIESGELTEKINKEENNFKRTHIDQINVINLKKYFGIKPALDGINLTIFKGDRVSITGPNGSGKTTFVEILSTTNFKTLGKIKYWFPYKSKEKIKHEIGMQFQEAIFPYDLKVKEILDLFMKISMWSISREELGELISIFKIENLLEQKGDVLSGGERQKLNVLIALLKKPSILILDEISTGLDIESIVDINNYIKKYLDETNTTLILISHNPGEAHRLTDKVIILKDGIVSEEVNIKNKSEEEIEKLFKDIYIEKEITNLSEDVGAEAK